MADHDDLDQLLKSLGLHRIREILPRELERATAQGSSHTDLLARLLREQNGYRKDRAFQYRLAQARLPERWTLETYPFPRQPSVQAAQIRQLGELDFVLSHTNLVFIGPTGVGKTGLGCGILMKALEAGYRCLFVKAQDLFDDMYASLADKSTRQLMNRLKSVDLLQIDEMGYLNLRSEQSNIFFKLMDERYNRKSTIITTNLDYDDWYGFLGTKAMVGALLDRLCHHCHTVRIDGTSLRTPTP
jgi:DNA replication protein DnaC